MSKLQRYKYVIWVLACILLLQVLYFTHNYYIHYPVQYASEWQYGYKDSIGYASSVSNQYEKIYVSDILGRPYIYSLFYTKEDPKIFRKTAEITRDPFGFVHINGFGEFVFDRNMQTKLSTMKKVLFIDAPQNVPSFGKILKTFYLPDSEKALAAYTI